MQSILLVEDDLRLREIYSQRLAAEGFSVVEAGDGAQALSLLTQKVPDLIIADVMMPNVSGFTMLQTIKSNQSTVNIRVILMTALSQPEDKVHGQQLGANRYLVKSQVTLEDLVVVVNEVLKEPPSQPSVTLQPQSTTQTQATTQQQPQPVSTPQPAMPPNTMPSPQQPSADPQATQPQSASQVPPLQQPVSPPAQPNTNAAQTQQTPTPPLSSTP